MYIYKYKYLYLLFTIIGIIITLFISKFKFENPHWRKFRIGIQSERIRTITSHSKICFRTNPKDVLKLVRYKSVKNQSE